VKGNRQRSMIAAPEALANVRIVLVEPQTPGNIGAVARAMKTMGLSRLVMVRPAPWRDSEATWYLAHGAGDVLETSEEHDSLDAAVAPLLLVAGTTNRHRKRLHATPERPETAAARLVAAARQGPVGVLFGNEDTGLSGADLSRCPVVITIPSAVERPSLNLSHAVQVVAYELFLAAAGEIGPPPPDLAPVVELEAFADRLLRLLDAIGFRFRQNDPGTFLASLRRCFGRAAFERRDLRTMHLVLATVERMLRERAGEPCRECESTTKDTKRRRPQSTPKRTA
jgi:tRNA (cytidine32/uridine32-2'-O)-methyltransferase